MTGNKSDAESLPQGTYSGLLAALQQVPKQLPCSYLYDAAGSKLYEKITELEEYYPFREELSMLQHHARDICAYITPGSVVVELGCGSASKTGIILEELLSRDSPCEVRFAGVDCSAAALEMAQISLLRSCPGLLPQNIELICAEYLDGVAECRRRFPHERLLFLWLGSSIGNLPPPDAVNFFRGMTAAAGTDYQVLLCADLWKDRKTLHAAYCDREGVTEAFIKNGVAHAFASFGKEGSKAVDPVNWDYEVDVNATDQQVEMWLRSRADILLQDVSIVEGERLLVEVSRKFTAEKLASLAYRSGLCIQAHWRNAMYSIQLLVNPREALERCWADTDALFGRVADWGACPIDVRHPFCFYRGHLASFAKLKLLPELEPTAEDVAYSRGIDPDVEEPSRCHSHPKAPLCWPSKAGMKAYVAAVRKLIKNSGVLEQCGTCPGAMRNCALALEHERMHIETLAYMLTQKTKADFLEGPERPATPCGTSSASGHETCTSFPAATVTVDVPGGIIRLGVPTDGSAGFVWDNEGPVSPPVAVASFSVKQQPVTIGEFHHFAVTKRGYEKPRFWPAADYAQFAGKGQVLPATWSGSPSGSVTVHWPNGSSSSWRDVEDEPVMCSLAEADAYCAFVGGGARIMTETEYCRLIQPECDSLRVQQLRGGGWEWTSSQFAPFPGFEATPEYTEYSTDFFDGKHFVLRGSSSVTHETVTRDSFRNFYQRLYPYVFAKFRLAFDHP